MNWQNLFLTIGYMLCCFYVSGQNHSVRLGCIYANDLDGGGFYYNERNPEWKFDWSHLSSIEYTFQFKDGNHRLSFGLDGFIINNQSVSFKTRDKHLATIHKRHLGLIHLKYARKLFDYEDFQIMSSVGVIKRFGTGTLSIENDCWGGGPFGVFVPINSTGFTVGLELSRKITKSLSVFTNIGVAYYTRHALHRKMDENSLSGFTPYERRIKVTPSNNSIYFTWGIGYQYSKRSED